MLSQRDLIERMRSRRLHFCFTLPKEKVGGAVDERDVAIHSSDVCGKRQQQQWKRERSLRSSATHGRDPPDRYGVRRVFEGWAGENIGP